MREAERSKGYQGGKGHQGHSQRSRPTINDVAAAAGVSRGTVSRVLNGGENVSKAARTAVHRAVRNTGYVANRHARSLVTQESSAVAFVLSEPQEKLFEDPNFSILMRECTQALAASDVALVLSIAGAPADRKRASRFLTGGHVDGALLVSAHAGNPLVDELAGSGIPLVACGKPLGHESEIAYVAADDRDGARQMTHHLRGRGRNAIATITGPQDTPGGVERLAGYRDVVGATEERWIAEGDYTREGGAAAMERLLRSAPELDAVFAASDLMASGAMEVLEAAGKRVPEDVAVGGFDDSAVALRCKPPLTTIRQPLARISREMVRLLLEIIGGENPAGIILPTELVERESA